MQGDPGQLCSLFSERLELIFNRSDLLIPILNISKCLTGEVFE